MDAAKAIGLTFPQRLAYVIVPQAVRRFLPPWINGVTDTVKGSALVSLRRRRRPDAAPSSR